MNITMSAKEIMERMNENASGETRVDLKAIERVLAQKAYRNEYNKRPEVIAKREEYNATPKAKLARRAYNAKRNEEMRETKKLMAKILG